MENQGEISPSEKEALAKEFRDLEEIRTREAKSRAVVLEILGDIPDADITPPKNVLFVCKLNPVTEEKDLKIIFSRFGNVKSCDIIKDYVTGDSLQYAFIEFETEESCNEAYFKMQNVLIDDRRIHVDFCQSVSGFWKRFYNRETFTRNKRHNSDKNYPKDRKNYHKSYQNYEKSYRKSYKRYGNHYNRDRSPEHRHSRRRSRSRSRERHRKRSRSRDRHRTERHRTRSRSRDRHRSRRHS